MESTIQQQIARQIDRMPAELQRRVLEFARSLVESRAKGERGSELLRFAGWLDSKTAQAMKQAVEEGCERVNPNEW